MSQFVPKVWGSEQWIVNTDRYCGKILRLEAGFQCSLHSHVVKDETFYVISGLVDLETGSSPDLVETRSLGVGDSARIEPGTWHRFGSACGATIAEFSTHHDDEDVVRHAPSGRLPTITTPIK